MARGRFRRAARRAGRFFRSQRRSTARGETTTSLLLGAGIYGALREKAANALIPVTSMVPLGNAGDEVILGVLGYMLAKKGSGVFRQVGKAAVTIEAARVGEMIASGTLGIGGSSSQSSPSSSNYG
jgi:hypothetical protein